MDQFEYRCPEHGVVDPYHRVFGHPGLHVVDGAAVCANLGVNPSLTIAAQAERAMSYWPHKGEPDPRPGLGCAYQPLPPVRPRQPLVTASDRRHGGGGAAKRVQRAARRSPRTRRGVLFERP